MPAEDTAMAASDADPKLAKPATSALRRPKRSPGRPQGAAIRRNQQVGVDDPRELSLVCGSWPCSGGQAGFAGRPRPTSPGGHRRLRGQGQRARPPPCVAPRLEPLSERPQAQGRERASYRSLRELLSEAVARLQGAGTFDRKADPAQGRELLISICLGFVAQRALTGAADVRAHASAIRALTGREQPPSFTDRPRSDHPR